MSIDSPRDELVPVDADATAVDAKSERRPTQVQAELERVPFGR
jgi:hypothetical protein